jgi:hypothetical protein
MKQIAITVFTVILGIYLLKWVNKNYKIPVIGTVIEEV